MSAPESIFRPFRQADAARSDRSSGDRLRHRQKVRQSIRENIADIVGMNVATISRVSSDKYVQTPHGVFEIKYFFNSGVMTQDGEQLAKRTVKQQIEEIIRNEDSSKPLSDQEIFQMLKDREITIARRTVTKYREELKILPARFRRRATKE